MFYNLSAIAQGQTEDCSYYIENWNTGLKYYEDTTNDNACAVVKYSKEAILSILQGNPPNWKELITKVLNSMSERHSYGNTIIFYEFVTAIRDVFNRKVDRSELQDAIKANKPIDKFPMTCIENFGEAHRIFFEPNRKIAVAYQRLKDLGMDVLGGRG